mmetsp:Transcript_13523/g.27461  ORF Transcript_13523/g.27461 Transcript_13523/m.27461 type:complete len:269 (-) Transcript_13523:117-923(-)
MEPHLGVFGLVTITMVTLLFRTDKMMHGIQPPLPILNHFRPRELVLPLFHCNTTAMETDTAQCLECHVKKSVVVYWTGQLDVPEITGVRFVMKITETGIVDTSVDGLPCHIGLISSNPRRNLPPIHRNSLSHRILLQLFRINHTKLQFLYSAQPHGGMTKVGGHLGEGDGSCFAGCAVFSGCHDDCFVCLFFWCFLLYECNCRVYIFSLVFCLCFSSFSDFYWLIGLLWCRRFDKLILSLCVKRYYMCKIVHRSSIDLHLRSQLYKNY